MLSPLIQEKRIVLETEVDAELAQRPARSSEVQADPAEPAQQCGQVHRAAGPGAGSRPARCKRATCCCAYRIPASASKPSDIARLFVEFQRVERDTARRSQGTGLGLALTRKLVEIQGGTIDLDSVVNEGTTVTVRLPLPEIGHMSHAHPYRR